MTAQAGRTKHRQFATCALHIGAEKTGTTSIQRTMALNRDRLRSQGMFAPATLAPHGHHGYLNHIGLMTYSLDHSNVDEAYRIEAGIRNLLDLALYQQNLRVAFTEEIARDAADCPVLLLSNEHLQSRLTHQHELHTLRSLLYEFCDDVRVVLYLRPQHEVARGLYDTALRNGVTNVPILPELTDTGGSVRPDLVARDYFRYDLLTERWAAVFGQDRMDVRIWSRTDLPGGDVVADFFGRMNVDVTNLVRSRHENVSLTRFASLVLREIVLRLDAMNHPRKNDIRLNLAHTLETWHEGPKLLPSRHEVARFLAGFADVNETVRATYFPDRTQLFEIDLSRYPDGPALSELPFDTTTVLVADSLLHQALAASV